jgi:uncharacterized membrane protein YuzA (DUF378 family)
MCKYFDLAACSLLIVGGLNWGLVGFFGFNLVTFLFGATIFTKIVYGLVALAALYKMKCFFKGCGDCCG